MNLAGHTARGAASGSDNENCDSDNNNNKDDVRCLLCQRVDPPYERAVAYGSYEGELRDLIHLLKFEQVRPAAAVLGSVLAETIRTLERVMPVGRIAVVPVPLYRRKQAQRGFNQAEMIAREALKELSRPLRFELCTGILLRQRETASQIGLTSHQRRENMRGAFAVGDATRIAKRDILLIDDVVTTGTTVSECARVLMRAGAARVWVATVARTLKISDRILMPDAISEVTAAFSQGFSEEDEGSELRLDAAAHG
jgi:ComF family protein